MIAAGLVLIFISSSAFAHSRRAPRPDGNGPCGGSGEIPTPFAYSNQRVELADQEIYILVGRVQFWKGQPYFEVDLDEHPWLANEKRKEAPYYPLEWSKVNWKRWDLDRVQILVEAHASLTKDVNRFQYVLSLEPLTEPILVSRSRDRNR